VGCSHNKCTFCPTTGGEIPDQIICRDREDILEASDYRSVEKIFLCDGDALIIPQPRLVEIFVSIRKHISNMKRVGCYANAKSILRKTPEDLVQLRKLGLKIVYLGVETGNEDLLKKINKGRPMPRSSKQGGGSECRD